MSKTLGTEEEKQKDLKVVEGRLRSIQNLRAREVQLRLSDDETQVLVYRGNEQVGAINI